MTKHDIFPPSQIFEIGLRSFRHGLPYYETWDSPDWGGPFSFELSNPASQSRTRLLRSQQGSLQWR